MTLQIFAYLLGSTIVGLVSGSIFAEFPARVEIAPAFGFLAGVLWPVTVVACVLYLVLRGATSLGRSFPTRRVWFYSTIGEIDSQPRWSKYWPDGQDPPGPHGNPVFTCCRAP